MIKNINEHIRSLDKYTVFEFKMMKKAYELYKLYDINDISILKDIESNINLVESKYHRITITEDNTIKETSIDESLDNDIEKLYYQKIYEIIVQMGREIGNVSDEEKIKWIYNYVFNMKYAAIPPGCSYNQGGVTRYNTDNANKKVTRNGQIVSKDSIVVGKEFSGVFSKYNLAFSREREGLCGAKSVFLEDLLDFCLNDKNYCISVDGVHMGVSHGWNAIINRNGVFHLDASNNWHGKSNQYLTFEGALGQRWRSYSTPRTVYNTKHFPKIKLINSDEMNTMLNDASNQRNREPLPFHNYKNPY